MAEAFILGEKEGQIVAARGISKLSSRQKRRLIENGVLPPLLVMLHSQDYDSIEAALFALLNLAFGNERNKVDIVKAGALPALLDVLQWQNSSLIELSLAALLVLSTCSANKMEMASSGVVRALIGLLNSWANNICRNIRNPAMLDILSTLQNLTARVKVVPTVVVAGGLSTLVQLIDGVGKSSEMAEKALDLLETIASSSEVALDQVAEIDTVIPMLVEAVEEGTRACQEHAVGILLLICKRCREKYRGMILQEGAMPGLMQLTVDGTWAARENAKALIVLLRDTGREGTSSSGRHTHNAALEEAMRRIDMEENSGANIQMVEEMIAKLRTSG